MRNIHVVRLLSLKLTPVTSFTDYDGKGSGKRMDLVYIKALLSIPKSYLYTT